MSKSELVQKNIIARGYAPTNRYVIADECGCAVSTVYRVIKTMRDAGLIDSNDRYTPRFVRPEELVAAIFADDGGENVVVLTSTKEAELCERLHTTPELLIRAIQYAAPNFQMKSTGYGMQLRRVVQAVA